MTSAFTAALWLVPDEPAVQAAIDGLAVAHGAPRFRAHLTLLGELTLRSAPAACQALADLAASSAPIAVPVTGAGESEAYFATAFVRCAETPELTALRALAQRVLGAGRAPAIGPHVSLVYAHLPRAARRAIASAHAIAGSLRFSSVALVQPGSRGWEQVEQWREICRHPLRA
jgi:putative hydrolase of the HAD superfamily